LPSLICINDIHCLFNGTSSIPPHMSGTRESNTVSPPTALRFQHRYDSFQGHFHHGKALATMYVSACL